MEDLKTLVYSIDFPGDIEYIPPVRKFLSHLINARDFSRRFAFRTEIIIDEVCNNAVKFGKFRGNEFINLTCRIEVDRVVMDVTNPGSDARDVQRLKQCLREEDDASADPMSVERGMKIVKILCNTIEVIEGDNLCVRILKQKNQKEDL